MPCWCDSAPPYSITCLVFNADSLGWVPPATCSLAGWACFMGNWLKIEFGLSSVFGLKLLMEALAPLASLAATIFGFFIIVIVLFFSIFYFGFQCEWGLICFCLNDTISLLCFRTLFAYPIIILASTFWLFRLLICLLLGWAISGRLLLICAIYVL